MGEIYGRSRGMQGRCRGDIGELHRLQAEYAHPYPYPYPYPDPYPDPYP